MLVLPAVLYSKKMMNEEVCRLYVDIMFVDVIMFVCKRFVWPCGQAKVMFINFLCRVA